MAGPNAGAPSVTDQLQSLHETLRAFLPGIQRLAVAAYDPKTDRLRTFAHSTDGEVPLQRYEVSLAEVPSLAELASTGSSRVINDLSVLERSEHEHTRRIIGKGYRSSLTWPISDGGQFRGFLFFDSMEPGYFTAPVLAHLEPYSRLATLVILSSFVPIRVLEAAVRVASDISHYRDQETGAHLDRMARYSRLMAAALAHDEALSDEWVEFIFLFSPMHDIGKIAIPDRILLKPDGLETDELTVMRSHVGKGAAMIDTMVREFGLGSLPHVDVLRNIVLYHHEAVDGSGYPEGLSGADMPLEARIVAVADVFDALTSQRPYKGAWEVEDALDFLVGLAGRKFDPACVAALVGRRDEVEDTLSRFSEHAAARA